MDITSAKQLENKQFTVTVTNIDSKFQMQALAPIINMLYNTCVLHTVKEGN